MTILLFLFGVAVAAGLFFILADILKLPRLSTEKALLSAGRTEKKRMKSLDALFLGWAIKLSKYIRMDEYKRHRLERTLNAAGMDMTPEVYLAYTILKPAAALLAVIPCLLIFPLLSPIVVLLSILLYFKESRKAEEKVAERREKIEGELPRFVATVEQELGASRDVLTILENYKRHAGPDFARELDVLTADMRSSSYEAALVRFEGRLASVPKKEQVTSASWGIWSPWWQENWEWVENWQKCWHTDRWTDADGKTHTDRWYHWVDNGWWEDHGWWEFDYNGYSASLAGSMKITPDEKSPTATASTLKSGYGVQEKVTAKVTTNQSAAVTAAQNAVTYFPEFGYENYRRLLEAEISGRSTTFQFKANPYSTYNRRTHFTPIWYPDGSYTPYTWLLDCWTPAGMLSMNLTDSVTIRGNLWEEWHIAPTKQR